jgi:hypothetical protein
MPWTIAPWVWPSTIGVDLDLANRGAIWKHRIVHLVIGDNGQPAGEVRRQLARALEPHSLRGKLEHVEGAVGLA